MPRPGWDEYFMEITRVVATRSTCIRRQVGAVIVKDRRLLTSGYNGPPQGLAHCEEIGCMRMQKNVPSGQRHELCRGLHAEQNAIIQAAVHGVPITGSTLYCTNQPCSLCTKMLINAGVVRVVYADPYEDKLAQELAAEAGLICEQFHLGTTGENNLQAGGSKNESSCNCSGRGSGGNHCGGHRPVG